MRNRYTQSTDLLLFAPFQEKIELVRGNTKRNITTIQVVRQKGGIMN